MAVLMPENKNQKTHSSPFDDPYSDPNNYQNTVKRRALIVLVVFGFIILYFGVWYIAQQISVPFESVVSTNEESTSTNTTNEQVKSLRERDTDGDGLNDFDELNIYKTSPYIADSDSDGLDDNVEIADGTDPNCPEGQTCGRVVTNTSNTNAADELFPDLVPAEAPDTSTTDLSNLSVDELRKILKDAGASAEAVDKISDEDLLDTYQEVLAEEGQGSTTAVEDNNAVTYDQLSSMSADDIRKILVGSGIPQETINQYDDAALIQIFQDSLEEIVGTSTQYLFRYIMKDQHKKISGVKRWALFSALVFFAFQLVVPVMVTPRPANAIFGVGDTSITIGDIPRKISEVIKVAKETTEKVIKQSADIVFKNVLKNYLNGLAYNYAVKLATGEKGQKPYFVGDPLGMLKDAGDAAAGDFLDAVASDWVGKSRCQGHQDQLNGKSGCKTDSQCMEVELLCPDTMKISDCTSSIEQKNKCLQAGCRIIECKKDENCPPDDLKIPDKYHQRQGAPECISSFSLCDLGEPSLKAKLTIMVTDELLYDKRMDYSSQCPITDIIDKYDEYRELIKNGTTAHADPNKKYLFEFSKSLNPQATEFGAYLSILDQAKLEAAANEKATEFAQGLAGEFKPVTSKISGLVKTPATFLRGAGTSLFGKSIDPYLVQTGSIVADAVGIFTNTLASKLIERYIFGIDDEKSARQASGGGIFGGSAAGISAAKIRFADLKKTSYSVGGEIDILSKLSSCPDLKDPTPDTCVIDSGFQTAISQEITVREALDEGLLDGTKTFGFDLSGNEPEYYNGYPYRSLVILRKYRIVPVGWELAAKYINKYARGNYSLNTLIAEYDNPNSPFYRLIDPNWVLKVPALYCKKQGAGPKVMLSSAVRSEDTNQDGAVDKTDAA